MDGFQQQTSNSKGPMIFGSTCSFVDTAMGHVSPAPIQNINIMHDPKYQLQDQTQAINN